MKVYALDCHSMQSNANRRSWGMHLAVLFCALGAQDINAQDGSADSDTQSQEERVVLEEVTVSARRREESLSNVPTSISVFSAGDIERSNIQDISDYMGMTPNVSFTTAGTRTERDISIRGVSNIGGQVSAISFYIDGFNIVNGPRTASRGSINSSINPPLYDTERIEVLRGPQGTFFGRNSTGGAINIITKKPTDVFYAEASAEYGRFDTWALGGSLNLPIAEETLFLRATVNREESDGAIVNKNAIGGGSDSDQTYARLALRALPTDRFTVDFSATHTQINQGTSEMVPTGILDESSVGLLQLVGHNEAISDGLRFYPQNLREINHDLRDSLRSRVLTLIGQMGYVTDLVTLTSITGYLDTRFESGTDLDFTSFGYLKQHTEARSDTVSQELRLSPTKTGKVEWSLGLLYSKDSLDQDFFVVPGPSTFLGLPEGFLIDVGDIHYGATGLAAFGEVVWHPNANLDLTLGGRYTRDRIDQRVAGVTFETPDVPGGGTVSFTDFSPRAAVTYRWADGLTTYATVSRGYKAGGLQLNVTEQLPAVKFNEESLWNYEVGLHLETLESRLRLDSSIFYMAWKNMQVESAVTLIDPDTSEITFVHTTSNAASATSKGVEIQLQARPIPAVSFGAAIGYLDAKFDKFPDAVVQGSTVDLSGRVIPRAPKWTGSAQLQYERKLPKGLDSFVRAEWKYRSDTYPSIVSLLQSGFPYHAPSFSVWNFRVGISTDKMRAEAFVENAFNEQYFTRTDDFSFSGIRVDPSYRRYGVRFAMRFGGSHAN